MPHMLRWHECYRQMVSDRTVLTEVGCEDQWDTTYGCFPLTHLWNWDQVCVPCPCPSQIVTRTVHMCRCLFLSAWTWVGRWLGVEQGVCM